MDDTSTEPSDRSPGAKRRLLGFAFLIVGLVLGADALLAFALGPLRAGPDVPVASTYTLREQLARGLAHEGPAYLLLGDSVIAGDVLTRKRGSANGHRVIDSLRVERHPTDPSEFFQVASDGMIPVDMERVVGLLERVDPEAKLALIVELNLRYFSPRYREESACSRDWLCSLPSLERAGEDWLARADSSFAATASFDSLRRWIPVWRLRHWLARSPLPAMPSLIAPAPAGSQEAPDGLEARMRSVEHYRGRVADDSLQRNALLRILDSLARQKRKALFFATPVNGDFFGEQLSRADRSTADGELARLINSAGAPGVSFASFDHPLFAPEHFIDHVHLTELGSRLLALNLLAELRVRLARMPAATEFAYDHDVDRTLVSRATPGDAIGPAWRASFRSPQGVAYDPGRKRVIVADTGNHTLRALRDNLRSVEPFAGKVGESGDADGPLELARFSSPRWPSIAGGAIYLIDGAGDRLRIVEDGAVRTLFGAEGARFERLASNGDTAFVLAGDGRIFRVRGDTLELALDAREAIRVVEFAVARAGQMFLADDGNRIWSVSMGETEARGVRGARDLDLLFENVGEWNLPPFGHRWPLVFDQVRFEHIAHLEYVERHDGLLVINEVPIEGASERAHLRFLYPESKQVFPWLKPLVNSNGHFPVHERSEHRASSFHVGSLALDQANGDVYWLEKARSRFIRIGDGLQGAARVGETRGSEFTIFGTRLSENVMKLFRPEQYADARARELGRRGVAVGLVAGSSLFGTADQHGYYSMARSLERELQRRLGLVENLRFDLFSRIGPSASLSVGCAIARQFMQQNFIPDLIVLEVGDVLPEMVADVSSGQGLNQVLHLKRTTDEHGVLLVLVDNTGIGEKQRDGLRPAPREFDALFDAAERAGVLVIRPTPQLLPAHLDITPWGNPPFGRIQHHGSPQAIDRTAELLASAIHPALAALFEGREPPAVRKALKPRASERSALSRALQGRWQAELARTPRLPGSAGVVSLEDGTLTVLVDAGKLEGAVARSRLDRSAYRSLVLAALRTFVLEDVRGGLAEEVHLRFVRFESYDEYGVGVSRGATPLFELSLGERSLDASLRKLEATSSE